MDRRPCPAGGAVCGGKPAVQRPAVPGVRPAVWRLVGRGVRRSGLLLDGPARAPGVPVSPARGHFRPGWMVIGFTPLPEMLGLGRMANEAHLGGFVAGLLVAALSPLRGKRWR